VIIGLAGHVDHGKTSLLRALTGVDADRLKEEKARGITIDLGFAYWSQADGSVIGFVDAPGHRDYLHNMLAGVTGVGALLLVVSAPEGVREQTREHLRIAALLGIDRGVVALTKIDLADEPTIARRRREIAALLAGTPLGAATVRPVSARTGEGVEELSAALSGLRAADRQGDDRVFRLAVDRVFSLPGVGTVATGPVLGGSIGLDNRIVVSPSGLEARVRAIHAQNRPAARARAGERAALNLAGVSVDDLRRGDVLLANSVAPAVALDATVQLAPELARALGAHAAVTLHAGAGHWPARLSPLSAAKLAAGGSGLARIALDRPACLFSGDRFILRDAGARGVIGGGAILDIRPPPRGRARPERIARLDALAAHGAIDGLPRILASPGAAVDPEAFAADHAMRPAAFEAAARREGLIALAHGRRRFAFAGPVLLMALRQMGEALTAHHALHPDQPGMTRARLRLASPQRFETQPFDALVDHALRRGEIEAAGAFLRIPGHAPRLSREHETLWREIAPRLEAEPSKPPRVNELALALRRREDSVRGLLKRLARRGDVFEVAPDHFLTAGAVRDLEIAAGATARGTADGWFGAAAYRDRIGGGRKMAILILEFMDRQGITIRKGDLRRMKAGGQNNP
jgi:selenocysteine-specific elongation factor